jgi:hypothetical protein
MDPEVTCPEVIEGETVGPIADHGLTAIRKDKHPVVGQDTVEIEDERVEIGGFHNHGFGCSCQRGIAMVSR